MDRFERLLPKILLLMPAGLIVLFWFTFLCVNLGVSATEPHGLPVMTWGQKIVFHGVEIILFCGLFGGVLYPAISIYRAWRGLDDSEHISDIEVTSKSVLKVILLLLAICITSAILTGIADNVAWEARKAAWR